MRDIALPKQDSRELEELSDAVRQGNRRKVGEPFQDGRLIADVTVEATSEKTVAHGLGRRPRGWFPVSVRSDASNEYPVETSRDRESLVLHNYGSADVTCDVWVW